MESYQIRDGGDKNYTNLKCAAFDKSKENDTYSCSGVRYYDEDESKYTYLNDSSGQYQPYSSDTSIASLVKNRDINNLRDYLKIEIDRRKLHVWYTGLTYNDIGNDIRSGNSIEHPQQSKLVDILARLKTNINSNTDYKYSAAIKTSAKSVLSGNMVETNNLRKIETDLYAAGRDCICYSDCTQFLMKVKRTCTCNLNCNCNYG